MDVEIIIERNFETEGKTWLLGTPIWRNQESYSSQPISEFENADDIESFTNILSEITGFFTIITKVESGWIIATDVINSIPLYYAKTNDYVVISNNQKIVGSNVKKLTWDNTSIAEYRTATYVTGSHSLAQELKQTQAASCVHFTEDNISTFPWMDFSYRSSNKRTVEELSQILDKIINRLIDYASGRQIVVPLSGGLDSRLLLTKIVEKKYDNVLSYTYGEPNNKEAKISKAVAKSLQTRWEFVEFNRKEWFNWYRTSERCEYDNKHWLTVVPWLREFLAVKKLLDHGYINQDSIIVPGHTGDMISGGHVPESFVGREYIKSGELHNKILHDQYEYHEISNREQHLIKKRIENVTKFEGGSWLEAAEAYERFDYQERQAKQITGQLYPHDFLDLDWWMPMWDIDFVDFWLNTTIQQRVKKSFYNNAVSAIYSKIATNPIDLTDTDPISLKENVFYFIGKSRLGDIIRPIHDEMTDLARSSSEAVQVYENDRFCELGIVSQDEFEKIYDNETHVRAYRAKRLLGEVNFKYDDCSIDRVLNIN